MPFSVDFISMVTLTLPLVVSGCLHMFIVKFDLLSTLKIPLSTRLFGQNKTWRGIVVMPVLTVPGVVLAQAIEGWCGVGPRLIGSPLALGTCLGLAYVLAELPNSWMKRRLGIRPGELSTQWPWFFSLVDQADSVIGCGLVYGLLQIISANEMGILVVFGVLTHLTVNLLLYSFKLRRNAF